MKRRLKAGSRKIKNQVVSIDFAKYFISGVIAFVVDSIVLNIVKFGLFENEGGQIFEIISVAKLISGTFGIAVSFYLNRRWSFRATSGRKRDQGTKMALSFLFSILIGSILLTGYEAILDYQSLIELGRLTPTIANGLTTGTLMLLNFFIYKFIVFKI